MFSEKPPAAGIRDLNIMARRKGGGGGGGRSIALPLLLLSVNMYS